MRVGAAHGNPEELAGEHVAGRRAATDKGGPRGGEGAVDPLCPPQAELKDRVGVGRFADPSRLGGDQGLEVDQVEQRRFQQLRFEDRSGNPQERLMGPSATASMSQASRSSLR